jgi:CheY-like chemotaxis protein
MSLPQNVLIGGASKRARILVADDQAVNRKLTQRRLEQLGFDVDVAENGLQALEAVGRTSYHLVFMDCHMPTMDGFQATEEIRRLEGTRRRTPVVALTASVVGPERERCVAAGMDDYVVKPVSEADLMRVLSRWILDRSAIDRGTISVLQNLGEPEASVLREVIGLYIADAPSRIASMREAIAAGNPGLLAEEAHALTSSSGNIGATGVLEICRELETIGRGGALGGAAELVDRLASEYERAEQALRKLQQQ